MSNPPRICEPNLTYHVCSRCIEVKNLMKPPVLKDLMILVIKMCQNKYNCKLINYIILDNHFHFFIQTVENGETISRIMQFIKAQYAIRYNKKMNRTGPFWNERFVSTIIEQSDNAVFLFHWINIYIAYNCVRKGGYVKDPREYKYCGINFYLDEKYEPPVILGGQVSHLHAVSFDKGCLSLGCGPSLQ